MENKKPQAPAAKAAPQAKPKVQAATKAEPQAKPKVQAPTAKAELQAKPKVQTPATKAEPQAKPKEQTPATKAEPQAKPKVQVPATKAEPQAKPKAQAPATKPEPQAKPKMQAPAAKAELQAKPKVQASATKAEPQVKPKVQVPATKAEPQAKPKVQAPATKAEPQAKPKMQAPVKKVELQVKPVEEPKKVLEVSEQKEVSVPVAQKTAPVVPVKNTIVTIAAKRFSIQAWQVALAVVVVLALVTGAVYLGTTLSNQNREDPIVDYTGELNNESLANPGGITMPGYPTLIFAANTQKVALELPNPKGNPCYFRYTLTIVETDTQIYQSQLLKPEEALETITLNQTLSKGTYTLRIEIDTFSLADGTTPMNGGVQEVTLIVK